MLISTGTLLYFTIAGEMYNTVLSVYSTEDDSMLPQSDEVLLCTPDTTLDLVCICIVLEAKPK